MAYSSCSDYAYTKQEMFYGKVPNLDEILDVVRRIQDKFNQVQALWIFHIL